MNSLKALLTLVYLTTSSVSAQAEVISLGSPNKILEFQRYTQSSPNLTSLNEVFLSNELRDTEDTLKSKYKLAVKGLLLEDLSPSIFVFKEIVSLKAKSFLSKDAAEIVSQSHMRLAHLEQHNSTFWLKHALFFNPDYSPDTGLFNPNLMKAFSSQKTQQSPYLYLLNKNDIADDNTHLFVDGVPILAATKIHPSGQFKFTFLKDGYEKLDLKVAGEEVSKLKPVKLKSLNLGTCKTPRFIKKYGIQVEKIYFNKNCIRSIQENQKWDLAKNSPHQSQEIPSIQNLPPNTTSQEKKSLFQKKTTWYIIGTAIATGVLVAVLSNQNSEPRVIPVEL